jgi:hypothetical protein
VERRRPRGVCQRPGGSLERRRRGEPYEGGAITGELELQTSRAPDGNIEAMVRYSGAQELYTVSGSPVSAASGYPDQAEHRAAHERILETLRTPGRVESGNEMPVDLLGG